MYNGNTMKYNKICILYNNIYKMFKNVINNYLIYAKIQLCQQTNPKEKYKLFYNKFLWTCIDIFQIQIIA